MAFRLLVLIIPLLFALPASSAQEHADVHKHPSCVYCNMNRQSFSHSRMLLEYADGTSTGTCSIHCSAVDLVQNRTGIPCRILLGDYDTRQLIDATEAFWVIGGNRSGVMTEQAKWAFSGKTAADAFIAKHGGKHAMFQDALHAAYEGLFEDMKITIERTKERRTKGWDPCSRSGK